MNRPKIKIALQPFDIILEILGVIALIVLVTLPLIYFGDLPDKIPSHFNIKGQPDSYSQKSSIWVLPALGIFLYLAMHLINRYPHVFNYPQKITKDNALRHYSLATRMIRILSILITCAFAYLVYASIQTAIGRSSGLGVGFSPMFVISILGVIGYSLFKSMQK